MALPHTSLIDSLELEVERGTFTSWACANQEGSWCALYADEACPPDWILDIDHSSGSSSTRKTWLPSFDLASLTKPLLANLWLRFELNSDPLIFAGTPLVSLIEPRSDEGVALKAWAEQRPQLTLGHLLSHRSGLPAWCWFGRAMWNFAERDGKTRTTGRLGDLARDEDGTLARAAQFSLTRSILERAPRHPPETTVYSDLNYYLLARVIENLGMSSFRGWANCIDKLNQKLDTDFWHASLDPERSVTAIPFFPYLNSQVVAHLYEQRKLENHAGFFGSVHDTNANILACEFKAAHKTSPLVSSHAGLFGSVVDVKKAIPALRASQEQLLATTQTFSSQSGRFSWGLDTPSSSQSTAGLKSWPPQHENMFFGHLGYSGTSLWFAQDNQFHVLLTNRTAQRSTVGTQNVPRLLFYLEDSADTPECWISTTPARTTTKQMWQPLPWQDACTLCFEHFRLATRYWNRNILRSPPDLSIIRRNAGQHLWSH